MTTGSVMNASLTLSRHKATYGVFITFTNSSGATLNAGQEVILENDLTVDKRSVGTTFPIGVVDVGGVDGDKVTVHTCFARTLKAVAKGGTINVGTFVKPNGTWNALGLPEYVAVANGDYASAIVIDGGAVDTVIELGVFQTPFKKDS
jgi:hypothetical protein